MNNVDDVIKKIRIHNPKRDISSIKDFKEMQDFLKYVDLPDNFAVMLRYLWPVIKDNIPAVMRLSHPSISKEVYNELRVGYSLYEHCQKNSLELEYSPKIQKKTPDWFLYDGKQKLIIEVVTNNKSESHSALETCEELIFVLTERELKSNGQEIAIDYTTSRFNIPIFSDNPNEEVLNRRYTAFCKDVSHRIFTKLMNGLGRDGYETDESGIEFKIGSGIKFRMTTTGYETCRVINSILDKGNRYRELSKQMPLIVAVANNHQNRAKAYSPSEIAQLLYYPDTVREPQFGRITDKKKHIKNIQARNEDLIVLEGILFYGIDDSSINSTLYEYYPNPHKNTEWEIPDGFKAYLDSGSNKSK
ncbi:MAG: hypothetical protein GX294_03855 [Candidatus Cloacimonetes bacterium]|nr:hypothetical protein [Candidatus Cloacimonadota bacterium]